MWGAAFPKLAPAGELDPQASAPLWNSGVVAQWFTQRANGAGVVPRRQIVTPRMLFGTKKSAVFTVHRATAHTSRQTGQVTNAEVLIYASSGKLADNHPISLFGLRDLAALLGLSAVPALRIPAPAL